MASGSSAAEAPCASARTAIAAVFPIRFISGGLLYGPCYTVSITGWRRWSCRLSYTKAIDQKRQELGDIGFRREMLLQVVPEEGQDVLAEDITYYDEPPFDDGNHLAHGVDLAISTKESANYTAIVSGEVTWPAGKTEIYLQPNPIIRRMTFSQTMEALGKPITGIAFCWARAASGQANGTTLMKSCRFIRSPRRRGRGAIAAR